MPTNEQIPEHPASERPSWVVSVLLALACVAGPFLAAPVVLHSANVLDFNVDLQRGLTGPLALAILAFLFLVLTLRLPGRGAARRAAVVLAVAWLFWLQGQLLVWDYGVLDGLSLIHI